MNVSGNVQRVISCRRFDYYFRSGIERFIRETPSAYVVAHASMIRYRRSIDFLARFRLHTRLVWYDERSLYFEQRFITQSDDFVRAVALCKNTCVNVDVIELMRKFGFERPECPPMVQSFIKANEQSSEALKQELHRN